MCMCFDGMNSFRNSLCEEYKNRKHSVIIDDVVKDCIKVFDIKSYIYIYIIVF